MAHLWVSIRPPADAALLQPVNEIAGVPASAYLGALGMTGTTAWVGMTDTGRRQPGEMVIVSAAAGAVGSVAGQIAKHRGARVVGIAGGRDKCAMLIETLGFDAAVNRRAGDWCEQLAAATPEEINVDFENFGGEIMDAVFARLNLRARVAFVRVDLRLQRRRAAIWPAQFPDAANSARAVAGLHRARPPRPPRPAR